MSNPRTRQLTRHSSLVYPEPFGRRATPKFFFLACAVLLCARTALALDPSLDISQYAHTSWKVRDGVFPGAIQAIAQTSDGYLWLGTEHGLYRFDGVRTAPWEPPSGEQLPSNSITDLFVARDGTLWVATKNGLASWRDGELTMYPEVAGQFLFTFLQDREGTIWFGAQAPGRLCAIRGGKAQCHGSGTFGRSLMVLYEDRQNHLWLSSNTGLWRWKNDAAQHYAFPHDVDSLVEGDNDTLLMATNDGLKQLVDGKIRNYALPGVTAKFRPSRLFRDRDGGLWIGGFQGVLHLHKGRVDTFGAANGLSGDFISTFLEDREGTVWVGTTDGLDRFREYVASTISRAQGLPHSFAVSVQASSDGDIWFITPIGLNRWRNGYLAVYTAPGEIGPIGNRIGSPDKAGGPTRVIANSGLRGVAQCLALDGKGRLWVGTNQGVFNFDHGRFARVPLLPTGEISFIAGDVDGNLWVSYSNSGLFFRTSGGVVQQISWSRFEQKNFAARVLLPDSLQAGVWLGFVQGGTALFRDGQVRASYTTIEGLGSGLVNDLRFGSRGALWAGTEGGLSRIKDGHVSTMTSKNGLPCDDVHWSMEDDEHFVWLYMGCGLVRIAPFEMDAWISNPTRKLETTVFDASDGVRNATVSSGYGPRVTRSPDGRIWFLPSDGVSVIDPRHLPYNKVPPPVHIEKIMADGKEYDPARGPLPPLVRDLTIDYTALSLVAPEKVHFRFKLEGQDKNWREVVNVRQVQYSNLAPKHYRFLVKACNNSGVWNEEGAALDFVIPPAWYQTNWFLALCVAAFLALLWALYQYRLHQMARLFNMRLEERVSERTRIARDLHDTLLQSFQGVVFRFQAVRNHLPDRPRDACEALDTALVSADQALAEGRGSIQGLRSELFSENNMEQMLLAMGRELASSQNGEHGSPPFRVIVEGTRRAKRPMIREEIYRIARELLRNAYRHAHARSIEAELRYDDDIFALIVRDDGKGIDPKVLKEHGRAGHWGLRGIYERAEGMGARLDVWSEAGAGTEVRLTVPAALAYEKSGDGGRFKLFRKKRIYDHRS